MKDRIVELPASRVGWRRPTGNVIFIALFVVSAVLAFCGCQKATPPTPPPVVEVLQIAPTNIPTSVVFIGQIDSPQNVEVRARVEAFVDKMLFTEGAEVKEGDPLFKLDDRPYQERLAAAKGSLAEAKAAFNKTETDVARLTPLATKRAVPQQDLDNALAARDVGTAAVVTAEARVEGALLDLGYCDIRAPVSGLIGAKQVSLGDLVGKGQPTLLVTISTLDPIWFYCNVSEVDYLKAQAETSRSGKRVEDFPVSLLLADGTTFPDLGKIVFIDRAVDVRTGTLRVRAQFPNPKRLLRPGMFARISIDLGMRTNVVLVPGRALSELQGKNFVWIVGSDNKATQRSIQVGDQSGESFVVSDGLKPGERIVLEGLQKVHDGGLVKPVTAGETAANVQAMNQQAVPTLGKE